MKKNKNERPIEIGMFILDIGNVIAGVEMAAAARCRLLSNELSVNTTMFSTIWNKNLQDNVNNNRRLGRLDPKTKVENLYDHYLEVDKRKPIENPLQNLNLRMSRKRGSIDYHGYDTRGDFVAFIKMRNDNPEKINWINYIHEKKLIRRDHYAVTGHLLKSDFLEQLEDTSINTEVFYNYKNRPLILKVSKVVNKKNTLQYIQLNNQSGQLKKKFNNEKEFYAYWYKEILNFKKIDMIIIDRVEEFYNAIHNAKQEVNSEVKLVPFVHSSHTGGDVFLSEPTKFYALPLNEMWKQDALIVPTVQQRSDIMERYGDCRIFSIPHSHNITPKRRIELQTNANIQARKKFKIAHVARYSGEKRHELAIQMFKIVKKEISEVELNLYGFGGEEKKITEEIKKNELEGSVNLKGHVSDVNKVFFESDLSIMTSRVEGFCMAIQESLANGCPVVSFDIKYGPSDLIKNGENGFLIDDGDIVKMANKVLSILRSPKLRAEMSDRAIELSELLSDKRVANHWQSLITDVIKN